MYFSQVDFTFDIKDRESAERCLGLVGRGILAHGEGKRKFDACFYKRK